MDSHYRSWWGQAVKNIANQAKNCFILQATQEVGFKHGSGMIQIRRLTLAARVGEGDLVGGEDRGRDWARVVAMGTGKRAD